MDILATSVWLRYLQALEQDVALPDNCYQGDYVADMGKQLAEQHGDKYQVADQDIANARNGLEDEPALDATIELAKERLGEQGFSVFFDLALNSILDDIRQDLSEFGVDYDTWFSERSLFSDEKVQTCIEQLKASDDVYEKGGAWWFRSTNYGDEKDLSLIHI